MLASMLPKAVLSPLRSAAYDATLHRSEMSLLLGVQQLFKINLGPPKDPEEIAVLSRLTAAYKTEMKAIRNFWRDEHLKDLELADKHSALSQEEEREHERLLEENEKENQRVAVLRMERNKQEEAKRRIEEIVRLEKKRSSTYVTLENLDQAIEFAIENPVSYSYAIDQQGKEIWEGTPHYELYKEGPAHAYAIPRRKRF
ncbi:hypothetical protein MRX96_031841 [Rhipicephalus microplus]